MELQKLTIIVLVIFNILGLILVALEKKGKVKAVFTDMPYDFYFVNGSFISFFSTVLGTYMIYSYSFFACLLYCIVFGGIHIWIKFK